MPKQTEIVQPVFEEGQFIVHVDNEMRDVNRAQVKRIDPDGRISIVGRGPEGVGYVWCERVSPSDHRLYDYRIGFQPETGREWNPPETLAEAILDAETAPYSGGPPVDVLAERVTQEMREDIIANLETHGEDADAVYLEWRSSSVGEGYFSTQSTNWLHPDGSWATYSPERKGGVETPDETQLRRAVDYQAGKILDYAVLEAVGDLAGRFEAEGADVHVAEDDDAVLIISGVRYSFRWELVREDAEE